MDSTISVKGKVYTITGKPEEMPADLFFRALHIAKAAERTSGNEEATKAFLTEQFTEIMAVSEQMVYFALGKEQAEGVKASTSVVEFRDLSFEIMGKFPNISL